MEKIFRAVLEEACLSIDHDALLDTIEIQIPKETFGDLSTPLAMGLAKKLKKSPREIAQQIIQSIKECNYFEKMEIAGPGFINVTFTRRFLVAELMHLLREKEGYLRENIGQGRRVQIEFVSANPTGPLHLGHGRGAALGAALSNLLSEAGFDVEKEFYIESCL